MKTLTSISHELVDALANGSDATPVMRELLELVEPRRGSGGVQVRCKECGARWVHTDGPMCECPKCFSGYLEVVRCSHC